MTFAAVQIIFSYYYYYYYYYQVLGTFILLIGIFAITDSNNHEVKSGLKPLLIGIVLWAIGSSFGINAGYGVNPARDFGPRLFTAMAGWGIDVFKLVNNTRLIYIYY